MIKGQGLGCFCTDQGTDPGLREHSILAPKQAQHPRCEASRAKIKMAGKKRSRKRPKRSLESSEKSDPVKNVTETSAYVEEKKPKLNDELEKGDKQLSVDKQEPNLATVDSTNNDSVGDLQTEESKYVPPFSRKRRVLKRSGAPPSPAARPKRSLRGVQQNLEQAQPAECPADIDDKQSDVCIKDPKDSPKVCFTTLQWS